MSEQELKALPPIDINGVLKFVQEHFSNVKPKRVTANAANPSPVEAAERPGQATLSDDELRAKVAELCGWEKASADGNYWKIPGGKITMAVAPFPDYLSDLNAMHEAEKVLTSEQQLRYITFLCSDPEWCNLERAMWRDFWEVLHATARERAEAFVATMSPVRAGESSQGVGVVGEARRKPHSLQDIEMTVTRDKQEIPVQVVIKSDGNHEAWVCEDKGGFKESQSIYLYPEELNEAEARYYGNEDQ